MRSLLWLSVPKGPCRFRCNSSGAPSIAASPRWVGRKLPGPTGPLSRLSIPQGLCSSVVAGAAAHRRTVTHRRNRAFLSTLLTLATFLTPAIASAQTAQHTSPAHASSAFNGQAAYIVTQQFLTVAPKRYIGSEGHTQAEAFIKAHFAPEAARGNIDLDNFDASTPAGLLPVHNIIVKFPSINPAKTDGIIVLVTHYETNYPLRDTNFVGANDGAATSALLIEIGNILRAHPPEGYSVWLVFDDGEEAIANPPYNPGQWTSSNSLYGTRHLAAKWSNDGTLAKIKAVLLADMIADRDLDIMDESQSTPWLRDLLRKAAANTHHTAALSSTSGAEEDDHLPFLRRGVPAIDIIDINYGPHTAATPDGWHHTAEDTLDKISARSLQTSGDLFLELIRLINQHG